MSTTPPADLASLDSNVEADVEVDDDGGAVAAERAGAPVRQAVAVLCTGVGAAMVVGGVFTGVAPRFVAAVAVLLGGMLALALARIRATGAVVALGAAGILLIGVAAMLVGGSFAVGGLPTQLQQAL